MKKYVAEMMGAFAIVFCGTGAVIIDWVNQREYFACGCCYYMGIDRYDDDLYIW